MNSTELIRVYIRAFIVFAFVLAVWYMMMTQVGAADEGMIPANVVWSWITGFINGLSSYYFIDQMKDTEKQIDRLKKPDGK